MRNREDPKCTEMAKKVIDNMIEKVQKLEETMNKFCPNPME